MKDIIPLGLKKDKIHSSLLDRDVSPYLEALWWNLLKTDFTGYDPGSYHSEKLARITFFGNSFIEKIWNRAVNDIVKYGGYTAIRQLGLPKVRITKAIALTAIGIDELEDRFPGFFDEQSSYLMKQLNELWSMKYQTWNTDFDYKIRGCRISKGIPGTINSIFAAEALWKKYQRSKDPELASRIIGTAHGLINCLDLYKNGDQCCFSYNPSAKYYVHNANLFVALLIARASEISPEFPYRQLTEHCLNHTITDFEKHGTLRYAGSPTPNNTVDNYHTGFVLRTLQSLIPYILDPSLRTRCRFLLEQGVNNYSATFVTKYGVFKFAKGKGSIQAHSLAEAILMYSQFSQQFPDAFTAVYKAGVKKAFDVLWDKQNKYFYSDVWTVNGIPIRKNTAPMPRWSWAWMFRSLACKC